MLELQPAQFGDVRPWDQPKLRGGCHPLRVLPVPQRLPAPVPAARCSQYALISTDTAHCCFCQYARHVTATSLWSSIAPQFLERQGEGNACPQADRTYE